MDDPATHPDDLSRKDKSVPEPGPDAEPRFDEPDRPAPEVVDAPGRNTEF